MEFRDGHIRVRTAGEGAQGGPVGELTDEARLAAKTVLEACPMPKDAVSACITLYFGEPFPAEESE